MILNCSNPGCATMFAPSCGICPTCGHPGRQPEYSATRMVQTQTQSISESLSGETIAATLLVILPWQVFAFEFYERTYNTKIGIGLGAISMWLSFFAGPVTALICARLTAPTTIRLSRRINNVALAILISQIALAMSIVTVLFVMYVATIQLKSLPLLIITTIGIVISGPVLWGSLYHVLRLSRLLENANRQPPTKTTHFAELASTPVIAFCTVCNKDCGFDAHERCVECNWFA